MFFMNLMMNTEMLMHRNEDRTTAAMHGSCCCGLVVVVVHGNHYNVRLNRNLSLSDATRTVEDSSLFLHLWGLSLHGVIVVQFEAQIGSNRNSEHVVVFLCVLGCLWGGRERERERERESELVSGTNSEHPYT